jgi:ribosome maturation factor RimP
MNIIERNIREVTEEVVKNSGYFLIDFILRGFGRNRVIEVYIDGSDYVNADDCTKISQQLNNRLQEVISPDESYRLDVSSPGVDRPLKFIQQFPKHLHKSFDLTYRQETETKKMQAELIEVVNEELKFLTKDKKEIIIKFNDIIKAKVLLSFS